MQKTPLGIVCCILAVTGCAITDSPTESEKSVVEIPAAIEKFTESPPPVAVEPAKPQRIVRKLTRDEIRRLQTRLKEVGFDLGPADGIAGARTKAAYARLQTSCSKWQSISGSSAEVKSQLSERSYPGTTQDVQAIQSQLHRAGFDPGPIDGILGVRTKSVLGAVKNTCPTLENFAGVLADSVPAANEQAAGSIAGNLGIARDSDATAARKQASLPTAVQSREEIRILQLRLRDAGFDPGPFDGVMGPKTRLALQQYERSQREKKAKIRLTTTSADEQY